VPRPDGAPIIEMQEVVVLHFQYVAWERMASKQRWYQAWEHLNHPQQGALQIFRGYNHMYGSWGADEIQPLRPEWLEGYDRAGIDYRSLKVEPVTWWDKEIFKMLDEFGPEHFRKVAIWEKNWDAVGQALGARNHKFGDPRSFFERIAHRLLRITQRNRASWGTRAFERMLRQAGW
jgi:hypothetical protein